MELKQALSQLDSDNNEHWTADGAPRIDAVEKVLGAKTTRKEITDAMPGFNRELAAKHDKFTDESREDLKANEAKTFTAPTADPLDPSADEPKDTTEALNDLVRSPQLAPETPKTELDLLLDRRLLLEAEHLDAVRAVTAAKQHADGLGDRINALNRQIERLEKTDLGANGRAIRAYIDGQNRLRAEKAAGLQRFLTTTGIAAHEVAKAVDPRAPIDRAMSQRKPGLGQARPAYRAP